MHSKMRQSFSAFACKAFASVFAMFLLVLSSAHAAGLGKLTVLSSLGHPLRAEIELTAVAKDEADSVVVKLASPDAWRQANLDFNTALYSLNFVVEKRGDRHVVKVTSGQALNEPFIGMLLELHSNSGRITREYTFLLDPAEMRSTPAVLTPPVPVQPVVAAKTEKPVEAPKKTDAPAKPEGAKPVAKTAQAAAPKPAEAVKPAPVDQKQAKEAGEAPAKAKKAVPEAVAHKVKKGDTLGVIAERYKYEDVSLEQMMVSIYRANPDAFIAKNINRLRVGRVLNVPNEEATGGIGKAEARKVIVAHAADFASYRQRLADQATKGAVQHADATQAAGGAITAQVQDKTTPVKESQDKLKLSKVAPGKLAGAPTAGVSAEDKLAAAKAGAEERARVKELEKNVGELQRLLELKNQELAAQQKHATDTAAAKRAADAATAKQAADKAAADKLAELKAAADKAAADKLAAEKALAAQKGASVPAVTSPVVSAPPVASAPLSASGPKPAVKKPIKRVAPPPAQKGFFDEMMDTVQENMIAIGGGGIVLLLLVYLLIRSRSKKKSLAPLGGSLVGENREYQNSLFGSSGGQSVDTNNSIFNSGFTPSASLLDANEVDPVAEADVYIAYGREAQAIEILKEALRAHPERNALRVKLLEIYASQKDVQAFDLLAGELYGLTRGEGEEWIYAAGLGMSIDPTNPLYAGGDMSEELMNRPTSLQGSLTQPRQDLEAETAKKGKQPEHLGYDFVQPAREQIEKPDLPLDLGGPEPVSAAIPQLVAKPEPAALNFNLDDAAPKTQPSAAPEPLGFDLGDIGGKKDQPTTQGMSVSETSTLDFGGMDPFKSSTEAVSPEDREFEAQLAAADRELAAIQKVEPYAVTPVDTMKTSQPQAAKAAPSDFDFGSINLDLAPAKQESKPAASTPPAPAPRSSVPVDSAEMDTKIELAAAYFGIGDKEGARELLDEVMQEGTPEQVQRAKESLAKFS